MPGRGSFSPVATFKLKLNKKEGYCIHVQPASTYTYTVNYTAWKLGKDQLHTIAKSLTENIPNVQGHSCQMYLWLVCRLTIVEMYRL